MAGYICSRDSSNNPKCTAPCQSGYDRCPGEDFCCRTHLRSKIESDTLRPASFPARIQIHMRSRPFRQPPVHAPLPVGIREVQRRHFLLSYVYPLSQERFALTDLFPFQHQISHVHETPRAIPNAWALARPDMLNVVERTFAAVRSSTLLETTRLGHFFPL